MSVFTLDNKYSEIQQVFYLLTMISLLVTLKYDLHTVHKRT